MRTVIVPHREAVRDMGREAAKVLVHALARRGAEDDGVRWR